MKTKIKQNIKIIVLALMLVLGLGSVYAWTGPTATPPNNNANAPINVSYTGQIKQGWLDIKGLVSSGVSNTYGLIVENGNVGIGTTTPTAKLEVAGQVKITGGSYGAKKVLTSDSNGLATWQTKITTRTVTATAQTYRWPQATATCGTTEVVTGGGTRCVTDLNEDGVWGNTGDGFTYVNTSIPSGNGWFGACDTTVDTNSRVTVYAICMTK